MKIVEQEVTLLNCTSEAKFLVEYCGRTAYQSLDKVSDNSAEKFIEHLIKMGHESVLEHASATIKFVTTRAIANQLVRHRIASYTQVSTRYCNFSKEKFGNEICVIKPKGLNAEEDIIWTQAMRNSETAYMQLIAAGKPPEVARDVLPLCLATQLVCTTNFRQWRHMFKARLAPDAQKQVQELMKLALGSLTQCCPIFWKDLV